MFRWISVTLIPAALAAVVACVPANGALSEGCSMESRALDTKSSGPLVLEVFGADTLCIKPEGAANLVPYTPTVRIRNTGPEPVTVRYQLDPARSFRSTAIWPAGRPNQSVDFNDVSGGASAQQKTIRAGEDLLISSWTRHTDAIRSRILPGSGRPANTAPQDFVVRFDLTISYDNGAGAIPVSETFAIPMRAVPVAQ
ncbi:MAG: hypothetical protein Q4G28_11770 [Neisseria sp.]|nr:hypothetical protein [Neisseria sp.]